MKTKQQNWLPLLLLVAAGGSGAARAFEPVLDCHGCDCQREVDWHRAVDLDGDGVSDFDHVRWRSEIRCGDDDWGEEQRDETDAFYPEASVDVYVDYSPGRETEFRAALLPGQEIEVDPHPDCPWGARDCWDWASRVPEAQTYLQALGLGYTDRNISVWPCDPYIRPCDEGGAPGVLKPASRPEALCGFRIRQPDGWHLGWLRLRWVLLNPDYPFPPSYEVRLADYAIHPEAERPIAAGEAARPTLRAAAESGGMVTLSWAPGWRGWRLERSATLAPGAWEAVPGVTNNTIRLPAAGPPAFFRLRQE